MVARRRAAVAVASALLPCLWAWAGFPRALGAEPRVRIELSTTQVHPGELFRVTGYLENPGPGAYYEAAVFFVLELEGTYWFWPSWRRCEAPCGEFDFGRRDLLPGTVQVEVVPPFRWPSVGVGQGEARFFGALMSSDLQRLLGDVTVKDWGWGPWPSPTPVEGRTPTPEATPAPPTPTPVYNPPPPWPEWVHEHWVWENEGTRESALGLVDSFLEHEIPVGAVIIDAPWETGYNNFEWDESRYPDAGTMVQAFHDRGVRVFVWITSMINVDSSNYDYAYQHGYLLNDGATIEWWRGEGSFLDYTHPEAVRWWHGLMDGVLDLGIDGWKCDGTDPFTWLLVVPYGYGGTIAPWEYSDMYYRDFFEYTRSRLGNDRVITSRPVDSYEGLLFLPFAPRDICLAGWVGDQDPTFQGLRHALANMFVSAGLGYVNFGSDTGGYRSGERTEELFIRWVQLSAFCPVFENGGNGPARPWTVPFTHRALAEVQPGRNRVVARACTL